MIVNGREVVFRETFLDSLISIENFIGVENPSIGRAYIKKILDFSLDSLSEFPYSSPKFQHEGFSMYDLRKATFQKKYVIIYLVLETSIEFLEIYHSSRNPKNLDL